MDPVIAINWGIELSTDTTLVYYNLCLNIHFITNGWKPLIIKPNDKYLVGSTENRKRGEKMYDVESDKNSFFTSLNLDQMSSVNCLNEIYQLNIKN